MKIAITGATGFIGKHVLVELHNHKKIDSIMVIGRSTIRPTSVPDYCLYEAINIAESKKGNFAKMGRPDVLIHLAWDGLPHFQSLHHFENELSKQYNFLKNLIEEGLTSLFVAGTCLEYGMQSGGLSPEIQTAPVTPYGYAKDALRQQLSYLKIVKPFNLIWGRLFYMYGEGQARSSLFSQLKQAVMSGENVFNMSGGEQLRDYLPVEDVAQKIVKLSIDGSDLGPINICSGNPISVREFAEKLLKDNGWRIRLNYGYHPYPEYEPMSFWGLVK